MILIFIRIKKSKEKKIKKRQINLLKENQKKAIIKLKIKKEIAMLFLLILNQKRMKKCKKQ